MHPKLKSFFDSRYAAPLTQPWKLTHKIMKTPVCIFRDTLKTIPIMLKDTSDEPLYEKYADALGSALKDHRDTSDNIWIPFILGGIIGGTAAAGSLISFLASLGLATAPSILVGILTVPLVTIVGASLGVVVAPVLTGALMMAGGVLLSVGMLVPSMAYGTLKAITGTAKKQTPPPAPPPMTTNLPPLPDSPPPTLTEQVQQLTPEDRRAFLEEIKSACADDFAAVANPPARTPLDVVPVYADLGHGKKHPSKPPSTP